MRAERALRNYLCAALLALSPLAFAVPSSAQDAAWRLAPGSPDFNTDSNWSTNTIPVGATAYFGLSGVVDLSTSADTSVQGFTFNLGAPAYTLSNANVLEFTGAGIVINGGSLRLTNDGTVNFFNSSSAGGVRLINNSFLSFNDTSTAGNATIVNNCCLFFLGASTAGNARIFNHNNLEFGDTSTAGSAFIFSSFFGTISFFGSASADNATIINRGILEFLDTTTAGQAIINNRSTGELDFWAASSAGRATIYNHGGLFFDDTSTAGNATIFNRSTGILAFVGSSTAGSASIINDGGMFFADSSSAGNASIINNSSLEFGNSSTAGNATITNNCCLFFIDNSSAGSATIINNDNLVFANSSTAGSSTIITENGGYTSFVESASGGLARFVINPGGVLDISGLTTSGTTAGSIEGAGSILLGDRELVVGALNTSTIFSGVIDGVGGSLVKVGTGSLTLWGANTYTGPTTVAAGVLVVNGSLVSDVTVNGGASLMGTGQVGSLTIMPGATHAPGNSIGTQIINGNYVNSGTLAIETNAAGQADRVIVNGGVNITGATLRVLEAVGAYGPTQSYLIIQNNGAGAVTGNFVSVTSALPYLIATYTTAGGDGNDVVLTLTRNDALLSDVARTPNQRAVAGALRAGFRSEAGSDGATIINSLLGLSPDDARTALDLMSGEIYASIAHVFFGQSRQLTNLAAERLWQTNPTTGTASPGQLPQMMGLGLAPGQAHERMGLDAAQREGAEPRGSRITTWIRGWGDIGSTNGDGNAEHLESRTSGVIAGGDVPVAPGVVAGVMGGWGASTADVDARASTAEIDSGHVAAYASAVVGDLVLKAVGGYSHHDVDVTRHIAFATLSRTASSSYGADQASLYGEAGWRWRLGGVGVMPWVGLRWSGVHVDGFTEDGAGALNLTSNGASFNMLDTTAGVRVATSFSAAGLTWVPQARVAWTHSFGDVDPRLDLSFLNGGAFIVGGVARDPNMLTLGAGLNVFKAAGTSGFLDYAANLSDASRDHAVSAGLRVRF